MARAFANASTEEISDPEEEEPDQRPGNPKGGFIDESVSEARLTPLME